jgi:hypothetical protein
MRNPAGCSVQDVFVQIAAYRDPQVWPTIASLFETARHPERLRVRVCWQRAPDDPPPRLDARWSVEIDEVPHTLSDGANWARRRVQRHWAGERYSLIIDSHLRFALDWDCKLAAMLEGCRATGSERPLITGYPPDFDPATYPRGRSWRPLKIYREGYIAGMLLHFAGHEIALPSWLGAPVRAEFLALGLLFSDGRFNIEVPLDPAIYFFGDEITTGVRAWCHGYDFFHPHRVVAWHVYARKTRRCHWEDHADWSERDRRSLAQTRLVLTGAGSAGCETGRKRSLQSYERRIGVPLVLPGEHA